MNLEAIRAEFPITKRWSYFNHAAVAPLPKCSAQRMREAIEEEMNLGRINEEGIPQVRRLAAQLLNARPEEIAFVGNTSEGLSILANGIRWHEGDRVITAGVEFPANVYPWLNLADQGVKTQFLPQQDGRIRLEDLLHSIDIHTRVVALSFVEFSSGYRNDIQTIGEVCHNQGIYFILDAIQGLGALKLDVKRAKVHALSTGGYKWLLGPLGTGILYIAPEFMDELKVWLVGWMNVVNAEDFLNYELKFLPDARRFESGCLNLPGIYGLGASLKLLIDIGIEKIERRIHHLTDRLCQGLKRKGYHIFSPRGANEWSGIVSFYHPKIPSPRLLEILTRDRIVVSLREDRIRVSPHFYNTEEEIDRLLKALP
jgi:selenocysteine lyase/cysteine desulfurase